MRETLPDGSFRPWRPFHRLTEGDPEQGIPGGFYHLARRAAAPGVPGTEVFIAPHDPEFDPDKPAEAMLSIDALCVNRDLPTDLPFGGGHPRLRLVEGAAAVAALNAVTTATSTLRPPLRETGFWRLVSHLSLGHLSVTGGPEGAAALKEILRLYDLRDTAETRAAVEALTASAPVPAPLAHPAAPAASAVASMWPWSSTRAPGRPAAFICWPRCWNTSWRCMARSTASPAPASPCAADPALPPPGPPAAAPACSHDRVGR